MDIKKDVTVSIRGVVSDKDMSDEPMTFVTNGRLYRKNDQLYVSYEESEVTGLPGTRTTVKASDTELSVIRTGKCPSTMTFTVGKKQMAFYSTPYGQLTIVINTTKIENTLTEDGGRIDVLYELEVENTPAYKNHLLISVEERRHGI